MDFDDTTCSATLSSPSVTGRFLKKGHFTLRGTETGAQRGKGNSEVTRLEQVAKDQRLKLWVGLLLQPKGVQSAI